MDESALRRGRFRVLERHTSAREKQSGGTGVRPEPRPERVLCFAGPSAEQNKSR